MTFLTYDFVCFAALFYLLYFLVPLRMLRLATIVLGSLAFQWHFGGWSSLFPVSVLALATFFAGRSGDQRAISATIALCVASLVFFKYTFFFTDQVVGPWAPEIGATLNAAFKPVVPAVIPLGLSFFTFEFVHYLVELHRGGPPIKSFGKFLAFALYWPTMVAGPIKRYQQFLPSLESGLTVASANDAMIGLCRIAVGLIKKWAADNITAWVEFNELRYLDLDVGSRWLFVLALSFRILLDFSGYSDMAIGYARMMGIVVPENFNWPYLARTPVEFWGRWHISLSSWIRDYIYIPLGGNRLGLSRRIFNALLAMTLCGLWHGASWNFAVWGIYHGVGLAITNVLQRAMRKNDQGLSIDYSPKETLSEAWQRARNNSAQQKLLDHVAWLTTMLFVGLGWLLFFYPLETAWWMMRLLFIPSLR